ncbi:ankyrin repeat-containing protein [Cavenderia fasciculata]|uniref:Ankyrin repeat-containing protein n=1 Tax=Cavenderia fasciculata TaxID=261658 RepID=F4Q2K8_CACFS|nr:ankyrin repeat-containing protein [Cavenderia fasciculata]EGG16687.1 ankyrin repeat-containing protein [Cavenderia fasciculata]|eukprot:XP_004355161.1 ankyrin repeat-containing protein [Cavenderia fasciculata]
MIDCINTIQQRKIKRNNIIIIYFAAMDNLAKHQGLVAAAASVILTTSIILYKYLKTNKSNNNSNNNNNNNNQQQQQGEEEEGVTKFPEDWNDLLKACYLESYGDTITSLANDLKNLKDYLESFQSSSSSSSSSLASFESNIIYKDNNKWNAFHVITSKGNQPILELLLEHVITCSNTIKNEIELLLLVQNNNSNSNNNNNNLQQKKLIKLEQLLDKLKELLNGVNDKGYTPLHIASCNGYEDIVKLLIDNGSSIDSISDTMETPLYLACANQFESIVRALLLVFDNNEKRKEYINQFTTHGSTALHVAVLRRNESIVQLLLANGADVHAIKKDGSTPLHVAATIDYHEIIPILLEFGSSLTSVNRFGSTPIHEACIKGNYKSLKVLLLNQPELVNFKDKDSSTPLHLACNIVNKEVSNYRQVIKVLIEYGVDLDAVDDGNATALHVLACTGEQGNELVQYLLDSGANPTIENATGWTPLHHAHNQNNQPLFDMLLLHCKNFYPDSLINFDKHKPRQFKDKSSKDNNNNNNSKTEKIFLESGEERLKRIGNEIRQGKIKNIVLLTGAGISTNAGIPAYRTEDGIYNRNKQFSFSMQSIQEQPTVFFESIKNYFYPVVTGQIPPTKTHEFIFDLYEKNVLLRNFTQNVDGLDEMVGLPDDKIVHAHGSLRSWRCSNCQQAVPQELVNEQVWNIIANGGIPYCQKSQCQQSSEPQSILRPDVIFFGESLPVRYHQQSIKDLRKCDLLIIIGTSLSVYPFASLVNDVQSHVPRILINKDAVGPFRGVSDFDRSNQSSSLPTTTTTTDLVIESRGNRDLELAGLLVIDVENGRNQFA